MKNSRIVIIFICILIVWTFAINYYVVDKFKDIKVTNDVNQYNVSGFSTDFSKIIDKNKKSIVSIKQNELVSTGFIYASENDKVYILTSYHGVSNNDSHIEVYFHNGAKTGGNIKAKDIYLDLAMIECTFPYDVMPLSLGDNTLLNDGEFVLSIGVAKKLDYDFSSQFGMISSRYREISNRISYDEQLFDYYLSTIQLSGEFKEGYSGAPLLNMNGETVGMISMKDSDVVFATTIDEIKIVAEKMLNGEEYEKIDLGTSGFYLCDLETYEKTGLNIALDVVDGYIIKDMKPNSLANYLGLMKGDVIVSINGRNITDSSSMLEVLYSEAKELEIETIRNGETLVFRGPVSND